MSERKTNSSGESGISTPFSEEDRLKVTDGFTRALDISMGRRLAFLRGKISSDKFVRIVGKSEKQLGRYERGDDIPFSVFEKAADAFGVTFGWLAYGQSITDADLSLQKELIGHEINAHRYALKKRNISDVEKHISESAIAHWEFVLAELDDFDQRKTAIEAARESEAAVSTDAFAYLPFYEEVEAAAGHGAAVIADATHSVMGFARDLLREAGASPQHCTVIRARGDSMSPALPEGALLVVDRSQQEIVANGSIMVVGVENDLLVKRIRRRLDGMIELISDNPAYPPETIGRDTIQQLRVVGRVVYFCRVP